MRLDTITLPALTHYADKLPADALPHLGSLAHLGLFLSRSDRRRLFRGLLAIFAPLPEGHKSGMKQLLEIAELDDEMKRDAVRNANRLRQKVALMERESICKFFRALREARTLRKYYELLDPYEVEGEETVDSILDGRAFRTGGLVSRLLGKSVPAAQPPSEVGNQSKQLPTYDPIARELRVGDVVMRGYNKVNFHEEILNAFQEVNWTKRIRIPSFFSDDPDRLRETIDQLNTPPKNRPMLIHFRLHGKDIVWEWRN